MRAVELYPFAMTITLPSYRRQNLVLRDAITGHMMLAAERIAPKSHWVERLGMGGDEVHIVHCQDEQSIRELAVVNQALLTNRAIIAALTD